MSKLEIILAVCICFVVFFILGTRKGKDIGRKEILELNTKHHLMYYKEGKYYYQPEFRLAEEPKEKGYE